MIPTAKLAQKRAKLRTKQNPTMVTLKWTEWPNGEPATDPTSGAKLVGDATNKAPTQKSAVVRAFVHFIAPTTSQRRVYSEVETGDAIVDFPLDLIRITDAGDTSLTVNSIVDEVTLSQSNRDIEDSAIGDTVTPHDLENLSLEFANKTWAQKNIGNELAETWDTLYSGINITRAMLVTKT